MHRKLFSVCKTLGLSNSRVESWEKLSGRKTKVGSVLRRSRWDSASVFAPGGSESLWVSRRKDQQRRVSREPRESEINLIAIILYTDSVHCGAGKLPTRQNSAIHLASISSISISISSCIRTLCTVVQAGCSPDKTIHPASIYLLCSERNEIVSFYHIAKPPVSVFNSDINVFLIWLPRTWARKLGSVISGVGNLAQATEIDGEVDQHQKTENQTVRHTSH